MADETMLTCPFCQEDGFDAWGLKLHLMTFCTEITKVLPDPPYAALERISPTEGTPEGGTPE